ncbi:MAG TPA: Gfo/Idh/MocA family oxidoreductase [Acidimicrobiales bacterium]|nr:Gfo/Idh/MocA family oxidoreductase [Acidimicrobiales bacterium]
MTARLPLAVLGVGHVHAPGYLRRLLARPDVKVVGLYDDDPATLRRVAADTGVDSFASPDACLERGRAVLVCSEPTRQRRLVELAAAASRPTLCEKPLGTTPVESRALLKAAARVPLSVALPVRYHSAARQLRRLVQASALGTVVAVWASNRNSFPGGWFADPARAGGGCLLDHVVHVADLLRWIWGAEFETVTAEDGVRHRPGLAVEDTAVVQVNCTGGLIATIDPSMSRPRGMPGALDLVVEAWGEQGSATLDLFAPRVERVGEDGRIARLPVGDDMDAAMLDAWLHSVVEEEAPPVPAADAFAATALSFAAKEAAVSHRAVRVVA